MRILASATVLVLSCAALAFAQAAASEEPQIALATRVRSLAENVLGPGLIRALTIADSGAMVLMRWESATYKPTQKIEESREQLYGESELVTGAILGALQSISRIRFSLLRKDGQVLAVGENTRGPGVAMTFSPLLGGGTHTPADPTNPGKKRTGGTAAAKD